MDPDKRRALADFYREEFMKHLEYLNSSGVLLDEGDGREVMRRAYEKILRDLDRVAWRSDFPPVAETLLRNFDALTRLSTSSDPRQRH